MKRFITIITLALTFSSASTQELTVDFEEYGLSPGEFLNGSDASGEFTSGRLVLKNDFNETYQSWTGWSISATTDTETPGFMNQFSAITGGGVDSSNTYAVSFNSQPNPVDFLFSTGDGPIVSHKGVYVTNSTYAYLSMQNGDNFAKKFGGADGTEPDYYLLTINGVNTEGEMDSVEFYLADYRFDNSDEDYIVNEWTYIDLSKFEYGPQLTFKLTTTDIGVYGPNTPAFFCLDNFVFDVISSSEDVSFSDFKVYPNPANEYLIIESTDTGKIIISDNYGKIIISNPNKNNQLDISNLRSGIYNITITNSKGSAIRKFVKI